MVTQSYIIGYESVAPKTIPEPSSEEILNKMRAATKRTIRKNKALQIELTQENMDLLLEEPPAESAPFNPAAAVSARYANVHWVTLRKAVRCTWRDSKKKKWTITSRLVEFEPDAGYDEKLAVVMAVAVVVSAAVAAVVVVVSSNTCSM